MEKRTLVIAVVLFAIVAVGAFVALKRMAPPAEPGTTPAQPGQSATIEAQKPEAQPSKPGAIGALEFMPDQAAMAIGIPSAGGMFDKVVALAKRFVVDPAVVDKAIGEHVAKVAKELGVPEAKSFEEIAQAKGIDWKAPIGIYFDFSEMQQALEKIAAKTQQTEAQADAPTTQETPAETQKPAGPEMEAQQPAPAGAAPKEAAGGEAGAPEAGAKSKEQSLDEMLADMQKQYEKEQPQSQRTSAPNMHKAMEELGASPSVAVLLKVADPAKAKDLVPGMIAQGLGLPDASSLQATDDGGVTVIALPGEKGKVACYAIAGERMVFGNSPALAKAVLAREGSPLAMRYGTAECPASSPDEVAALVRLDKMMGVASLMPAWAAAATPSGVLPTASADAMKESMEAMSGTEPAVVTFGISEEKVELLARVDSAAFPKMKALRGEPAPLKQALMFPDATRALLTFAFTPEAKEQMQKMWFSVLPPEIKEKPEAQQMAGMVQMVLASVDREISIGIAPRSKPEEVGPPSLMLAVDLKNVEQAKGLLQTFGVSLTPTNRYQDVDVTTLPLPIPAPTPQGLSIAFPGNMLAVSTDLDTLKGFIDRTKSGDASKLFASLDPPMALDVPRESLLMIKGSFFSDIVKPMAAQWNASVPAEKQAQMDKVAQTIREIRMVNEMDKSWYVGRATLYMQ